MLSRRVEATEGDLEACLEEIVALGGDRFFGIDLLGGPAALLEAVLLGGGERVFHLPGTAVNRAREGYRGEHKSDRGDARVIADQLRMRWRNLQEVRPRDEEAAELRALVAHRRAMVEDQASLIARLRALLLEVFPGLEAALDLRKDRALLAVKRVATPSAARRLGISRLARWLRARGIRRCEDLAGKVVEAAKGQRRKLPAAEAKAALRAHLRDCRGGLEGQGAHSGHRRPARRAHGRETRGGAGAQHARHGPAVHCRVPFGGRRPFTLRLGRRPGRSGGTGPRDAPVGRGELPETSAARKPHAEEPPLPLRLRLHCPPWAEQDLLPAKTGGG